MKKTILLLAILSLVSCKKEDKEIIKYDDQGKITSKRYFNLETHKMDSIILYKNEKITSKSYDYNMVNNETMSNYTRYFNEEGKVSEEGKMYIVSNGKSDGLIRIGKWKFYDSKMSVKKVIEYINLCGKTYLNQEWNYDEKGRLDVDKSVFFTCKITEPTKINGEDGFNVKIFYKPFVKKGSICTINLSKDIDSTFCNAEQLKMFTLRSNANFTFTIPIRILDLKDGFKFKGYIDEHNFNLDKNDTLNPQHSVRRIFFAIPLKL